MPIALVILVMTLCVSAFAGLRDESWSVNPSDFRYDMSLYFRMENKDFEDLSLYEIGAFVDDECRGLAEKLELTQGETCLYMRIRSNVAEGEVLSFYMKDKSTGQIVHIKGEDGSSITFKADSRIGLPSDPFVMSPFYTAVFKIDGEVIETLEVGYGDPIAVPEVPEKEGYTFNGWVDLPATMPAYDIEMHSSYSVNYYSLTFMAGDEEIFSGDVAYGSDIIVPVAPEKEGQVFSWNSDIPQTMPANDVVIRGSYDVLKYNVVFKLDGETVHTEQVAYGEVIPVFNDIPSKEGYSFSGWTPIPETMPARDVEINGSYAIDHYTITFTIGDEVLVSQSLAFGEEVILPEAPAREGYTFSGWGDVPSVMPASDLSFKGDYIVNKYNVVFRIDQDVYETLTLEYGAPIEVPANPEMVGHTFSGWGDVPATMPAYDLVFVGTFEDIYYTVTFRIGDEIIKMADLPYEAEIILPEVPEKEGYSFGGWGDVPATMPASNIEIEGSYAPNSYMLKFQIDDYVFYVSEVLYGSEIVAPEAPENEGHTFSGWGVVPATMPASDLVISGTYSPNIYTLTFFIDGVIFYTTQVTYGSEISAPEAPVKEGHTLVGWTDMPATMPAYDLNLDASYSINSYKLTFKVGEEEIFSGDVQYGAEIVAPEVPAKDGHSFSGWGMVPSSMPANDLEISGSYEVNIYNLSFMIDGESFYTTTLAYGSDIIAPVVPEVEGKTFSGWGEVPYTMPANDLYINGTYSVNYYLLTFKVWDEIVFSGEVPYGAEITSPTAPEKEGHTFIGWGDVPSSMPASALEFEGSYEVNSYSLVFMLGDDVLSEATVPYGSEILIPEVPEKEGHSFSGWGVVPAVMPASDLVVTGSYEINSYTLVLKIGDEIFYSAQLAYGTELSLPEVPAREGYSFSGWGDVPASMPAKDLELSGVYNENEYNLVFRIDGEVISSSKVRFGSIIIFPEVEEKEGYTFSGWGVGPYIMPAYDLEFNGSYEINHYNLTFKLNDEVIYSALVAYGSEIIAPEVSLEEGDDFSGWSEYPATMPAHDVEVTGTIFNGTVSVEGVYSSSDSVTVVTVGGVVILRDVKVSELKDRLSPGVYIINGKKMMVGTSK